MQHEAADNAVTVATATASAGARYLFLADRARDVITREIIESMNTRAMVRAASYALSGAVYSESKAPGFTVAIDVSIDTNALREALSKCITVNARRVWV